nr:MAG: nonstructural protein [Microvirus sp.]
MLIFSIIDRTTKDFGLPFYQPTKDTAIRSFRDLANDPESMIYKHPDDFTLFELGQFSPSTGQITGHDKPIVVVNALEIQNPQAAE